MKEASIKCPHCGTQFTVRQVDADELPPEAANKIWEATDEAFKIMNATFRKIFDSMLWRK